MCCNGDTQNSDGTLRCANCFSKVGSIKVNNPDWVSRVTVHKPKEFVPPTHYERKAKEVVKYTSTTDAMRKVVSYVRKGFSLRMACREVGLSRDTLSNWQKKAPEYARELREARKITQGVR